MDINEKEVTRIDASTFDFDGKRYSKKEFKEYVLRLAESASIELYSQHEKDEAYDEGFNDGWQESGESQSNDL